MPQTIWREVFAAAAIAALSVLLANPFDFWMADMAVMLVLAALVVAFTVFAAFIWRERPTDEREELHRLLADRIAFLTGSAIIVIAIIVESVRHSLDPWLVFALMGLLLGKIGGLLYGRMRH